MQVCSYTLWNNCKRWKWMWHALGNSLTYREANPIPWENKLPMPLYHIMYNPSDRHKLHHLISHEVKEWRKYQHNWTPLRHSKLTSSPHSWSPFVMVNDHLAPTMVIGNLVWLILNLLSMDGVYTARTMAIHHPMLGSSPLIFWCWTYVFWARGHLILCFVMGFLYDCVSKGSDLV